MRGQLGVGAASVLLVLVGCTNTRDLGQLPDSGGGGGTADAGGPGGANGGTNGSAGGAPA